MICDICTTDFYDCVDSDFEIKISHSTAGPLLHLGDKIKLCHSCRNDLDQIRTFEFKAALIRTLKEVTGCE